MTANPEQDFELKVALLDDVFTIINMEKVTTGEEEQVGGFDLIWRNGPINVMPNSIYGTYLGSMNQRDPLLKRLAKQTAKRLAANAPS